MRRIGERKIEEGKKESEEGGIGERESDAERGGGRETERGRSKREMGVREMKEEED